MPEEVKQAVASGIKITPDTSISFSILALMVGLVVGGGVSYGVMFTKIETQGEQISSLSVDVRELTKSVSELNASARSQGEINTKFVEALGDIKRAIDKNVR